jgi:Protein of unknown function (DUF3089)
LPLTRLGLRVVVAIAIVGLGAAGIASAGPSDAAKNVPFWPVWLCLPGETTNWCDVNLNTTAISANGAQTVSDPAPATNPPVDCFYVYPTVSTEKRANSDLTIQPAEAAIATVQAGRFEQDCRLFAPMYNQVTEFATSADANYNLEYTDVLAAWRDYLAHYNDGRGFVLIGHSEGSFILERLIRSQIESSPERKLLISAILAGGDVTVKDGSDTGGTFRRIPACDSETETGCVVAYSTWDHTPPKDAGLQGAAPGTHVLCVNPAAPAGGTAPITPLFVVGASEGVAPLTYMSHKAIWVSFPDMYTAHCVQQGRRAWLRVNRIPIPGDKRPAAKDALTPEMGLHAADITMALPELVALVHSQSTAWLARH